MAVTINGLTFSDGDLQRLSDEIAAMAGLEMAMRNLAGQLCPLGDTPALLDGSGLTEIADAQEA